VLVHVFVRSDGLAAVVVADTEYPLRVAFSFLNKVLGDFEAKFGDQWKKQEKDQSLTPDFLQKDLSDFQDPKAGDKLLKIQEQLDDIKAIMYKNLEDVIARGKTIDQLVEDSERLSESSKMFYKDSKKLNSCCKSW